MGGLNTKRFNNCQYNIICDLAHNEKIDGLIITDSTFVPINNKKEISEFCRLFAKKPIIISNDKSNEFPSVICSFYDIFNTAINHLIKIHGFHRIAFMTNKSSRSHYEHIKIFNSLAEKYLFPVNEEWSFNEVPAIRKDNLLFDILIKLLKHKVEAIIGNNNAIVRIVKLLMENGIRVPEDIAVISLGDQWKNQFTSPSITAINRNYGRIGYDSVISLLDLLLEKKIPAITEIPVKFLPRRSCGCNQHSYQMADIIHNTKIREKKQFMDHKKNIIAEFNDMTDVSSSTPEFLSDIINAYDEELKQNEKNKLLRAFELAMSEKIIRTYAQYIWQNLLSIMIKYSLPFIKTDMVLLRMQAVWQQIRLLIADRYQSIQSSVIFHSRDYFDKYRLFYNTITATTDVEKIIELLFRELPKLGIAYTYLVLYENPGPYHYPDPIFQWSNLVMAYTRQGRINLGKNGIRFQTREILPKTIFSNMEESLETIMFCTIESLVFETSQIGYIILGNMKNESEKTYWIKKIISIALQAALLVKQKQRQKTDITGLYEKLEKENARMNSELNIMKRLKQIILPGENELTIFERYHIASSVQPSNEMSGDYYDIIKKNSCVFLGIGEISGEKLEGSVIMIMVQAMVRALIEKGETNLTKIFYLLNQILNENTRQLKNEFELSLLLVKIEQKQISMIGCLNNPFIVRNSGRIELVIISKKQSFKKTGCNLKNDWLEKKVVLDTGECMLLFTNGMTKANGINNTIYGEKRLEQIAASNYQEMAGKLKDIVMADFRQFTQGQVQDNDISLVVIKRI